jgi:hypothetical protein
MIVIELERAKEPVVEVPAEIVVPAGQDNREERRLACLHFRDDDT